MAKEKSTIDFSLAEIDVQHFKNQGYIALFICSECKSLVIGPMKAEHVAWHKTSSK